MFVRKTTVTVAALVAIGATSSTTLADERFVWTATCTVACSTVGIEDGDSVSGVLVIDAGSADPLDAIAATAITDFSFSLGNVVMTPATHTIAVGVDANIDASGGGIDMRLLEVQAISPTEPGHIQQPNGIWNAFPIGGVVFLVGVDGNYQRQIAADTDGDGVDDDTDNCTLVANPAQLDSNGDGYGNACDCDLNDDATVDFSDLGLLKAAFFSTPLVGIWNPGADFNGDLMVDFLDLGRMKQHFFEPPGPSALAP